MITEYILPKDNTFQIRIPEDYLNCPLEISIRKIDDYVDADNINDINKLIQQTAGIIPSGVVEPKEWQNMIRNEWETEL